MRFVACAILTIGLVPGCAVVQVGVTNPIPALTTVAVAPFFNLSQEPEFVADGRRVALAYYAELQKVPGYQVIPVGVVEEAARAHRLELSNPDDALRLCELLGCDAVVVGAITDFDPYYPPRLGLQVSWYSPYPWRFEPGIPLDPQARNRLWQGDLDARRAARREEAERGHRALGRAFDRCGRCGRSSNECDCDARGRHGDGHEDRHADGADCRACDEAGTCEPPPASDAGRLSVRGQSPESDEPPRAARTAAMRPRDLGTPPRPPWWEGEARSFGEWRVDADGTRLDRPPDPPERLPAPSSSRTIPRSAARTQSPYVRPLFDDSADRPDAAPPTSRPTAAPPSSPGDRAVARPVPDSSRVRSAAGVDSSTPRPAPHPPAPARPRTAANNAGPSAPALSGAAPMPLPDGPAAASPVLVDAFDPRQPLMSYTRLFDGSDAAFVATLRDWLELTSNQRAGGWEASLHRTDEFLRFCSHLMIVEMLTLHGGESQHRFVVRKRRYR